MEPTKVTVIYHSADFDGIFCRETARKFLPDAELIGWDFKDAPLQVPEGRIYILDLPVDRVFGCKFEPSSVPSDEGALVLAPIDGKDYVTPVRLDAQLKNIVWIDHHKSSIESHPKEIAGYRIDGVAACRLAMVAFQHLVPETGALNGYWKRPTKQDFIDHRTFPEPLAVRLVGEYDIWDKRDPRADILQFGLRSRELTDGDWSQLLSLNDRPSIEEVAQNLLEPDGTSLPSILHGLLRDGELLQKYQQRNDAGTMHRSFMVAFEGFQFLALNTARCNSLTFAEKDTPDTGHEALMVFYFDGKKWNTSLYHAKHRTDLDLSKIAVKYGGGGHRGACGFQSTALPWL